jgi:hypothetical protein
VCGQNINALGTGKVETIFCWGEIKEIKLDNFCAGNLKIWIIE